MCYTHYFLPLSIRNASCLNATANFQEFILQYLYMYNVKQYYKNALFLVKLKPSN